MKGALGKAKGVQFLVWDVGGQEKLRPLWRSYTRYVAINRMCDSKKQAKLKQNSSSVVIMPNKTKEKKTLKKTLKYQHAKTLKAHLSVFQSFPCFSLKKEMYKKKTCPSIWSKNTNLCENLRININLNIEKMKFWFFHCRCTDGIVFVVDSVDVERMEEAKMELMRTAKCSENHVSTNGFENIY